MAATDEEQRGRSSESSEPQDTGAALRRRSVRSTAWTLAGNGAIQVLRLATNALLSRMLLPSAFGMLTLVNTLLRGLELLSDLGVRASIIRHPRGNDPAFVDTLWTVQMIRGACLALICIAVAHPYAKFYESAELSPIIFALALIPLLNSGRSTSFVSLERNLELGRLWRMRITARVVGVAVTLGWALRWPSVWALVAGQLANALCLLIFSHVYQGGHRNRFAWEREARLEVVRFGRWILVATALSFAAERVDRLALGKIASLETLGIYGFALSLAELPAELVTRLSNTVLFPLLSAEWRMDRRGFAPRFRKIRSLLLAAGGTAVVSLVLGAPLFFSVLFDELYHDAGWMAQLLALWCWIGFLRSAVDRTVLAMGDSRSLAFARAVQFAATTGGILLGYRLSAIPGVIGGVTFGALAAYGVVVAAARRQGLAVLRQDAIWTSRLALATTVLLGLCNGVSLLHPGIGRWLPLPLVMVLLLGLTRYLMRQLAVLKAGPPEGAG